MNCFYSFTLSYCFYCNWIAYDYLSDRLESFYNQM
ncbi:hypothetical protein CPS_1966 [Colwellia psychrerythraea 34H]|uniref:Uncharacterized protein n=1 Tax=Colwellia psychrerythraea (strain 34H / ATCC BAA-681) TaxID=167879 RepID=Q483S0_COLP3|nr:hypothetical protein CPS_1966 [Colwellia psychrerythraea 34H]